MSSYTAQRTEVIAAIAQALEGGSTAAYYVDTRDGMAMATSSEALLLRAQQGRDASRWFDGTAADVYAVIDGSHAHGVTRRPARWSWHHNTRCKYVGLVAYMGKLYATDRDHNLISVADLRRQA